jgi:peptidoglycan hydrolase-like protein with peptidoglycan-binding domain
MTTAKIRIIQEALKDKGYDPGPIDNVLGAETKKALEKFQQAEGLPIGGLNLKTLTALGIEG